MEDDSKPAKPVAVPVDDLILRQTYNESLYWERAKQGEFYLAIYWEGVPTSPEEPPGTESKMVSIRRHSDDIEVARVHLYLRPGGTLQDGPFGGKGRPDPKRVYDEKKNVIYKQRPKPKGC